jgi:formylglycine-generating enzyme required for sulfatase activity
LVEYAKLVSRLLAGETVDGAPTSVQVAGITLTVPAALYGQGMTQLSGKQIEDLVDALIHAYPSEAELERMVRIRLNVKLAAVAAGGNLRVLIFNLITWAERNGRVDELVAGAVNHTPGNPMLQEYVRRWPAAAAPAPPPSRSPSGPAAIDIFLSYSRRNLAAMRTVEAVLRGAGLSVWTDEGLEAGTPSWTGAIEEAVGQAQAMVVLLSPAAKASVWVENEVALAQRKKKRIYPLLVDGDEDSAVLFRLISVHWVDGRQGLQAAVGQVLTQMGRVRKGGGAAVAPAPSAGDEELAALARRVKETAREAARLRASRDPLGALEQHGLEWVTVPAGEFMMGSNGSNDEKPIHRVHLSAYQIARHPVTNAQYELFVKATSYAAPKHWKNGEIPAGKEKHPVVYVTWQNAQAFCVWAGVRLPTEAEWEKAARGTDERKYPWGNEPPTVDLCNFNGNVGDTTPVGLYPKGASPYDALDMAGNVWEWVNDWYDSDYYSVSPRDNPQGPAAGSSRVLRGGSWGNNGYDVRSAYRFSNLPDYWFSLSGFRCVRSL